MRVCVDRRLRLAAVVMAALTLTVCGGEGDSGSPAVPSVPVITPTATPIVAPTPEPPVSASCARLPAGATKYSCRTEAPTFQGDLEEAIDTVKREHPEAFDGDQVKNVGLYVVELIKAFDRKGICADWDGEELGVATSHDLDDVARGTEWPRVKDTATYYQAIIDILVAKVNYADEYIRTGPGIYRGACYPAAF